MHGVARRVAELTLEPRFLLALQPPQYFNVNFVELSNLARGPQLTVLPNHFDDDATMAHGLGQFEPADAKLLKPLLVVERLAPTVLRPCRRISRRAPLGPLAPRRHRLQNLDLEPDRVLECRNPRVLLSRVALVVPLSAVLVRVLLLGGAV